MAATRVYVGSNGGGAAPWTVEVEGAAHPLGVNRGEAIWREDVLRATLRQVLAKLPDAVLDASDAGWLEG